MQAGHGDHGHQFFAAGQGQLDFGIDRTGLNVSDFAFENIAGTDFHGETLRVATRARGIQART
ncbi:hypothetical protein D3C84_1247380 [compost metagenome]